MSTYNDLVPPIFRPGHSWNTIRQKQLKREPWCRSCGVLGYQTKATHVDHIVPRSRGGSSNDDNLQSLCKDCHDGKSGREKHGGLDTRPVIDVHGNRVRNDIKRTVEVLPARQMGKSARMRFLFGRKSDVER